MPKKLVQPKKPPKLSYLLSLPDDQFPYAFLDVVDRMLAKFFPPGSADESPVGQKLLIPVELPSVGYGEPLSDIWGWLLDSPDVHAGQPRKRMLQAARAYILRKETTQSWSQIAKQFGAPRKSLQESERKFRNILENNCKLDLWDETCGLTEAS